MTLPSIDEQRAASRLRELTAERRYRILFVGRAHEGPTDIVAALHRALEALGHTVFVLDTEKHPTVLHNPTGASGGLGPVYLKVSELGAILDTFRPQVLVTCAGGLVLDEPGAEELRARGIMSLGMTLSDPDAQSSLVEHVGRFDFHTTNSRLAVARYEQAGVSNTIHLPFAIDRAFVEREVVVREADRAQVAVIGHARPERIETMKVLDEHFDIATYGDDWPFEGSHTVRGERLVEVARAAPVHINFAATHAGYTNVKCGVFESIGSGALVCTSRFDEMAELFEYGTEILGFDSAQELVADLNALFADPTALEGRRRRAFARLLAEHLYEHRWLQLFEEIEARVGRMPEGSPEFERLGSVLEDFQPEPRHVIVSGYYGAANLGDDLLLDSIAEGIARNVPGANVVVAGQDGAYVEHHQGYQAFDRADAEAAAWWSSRASGLVLGAGGLWHDYTIVEAGGVAGLLNGATKSPAHLAQLPLLVRAHGGDVHVFGIGVGPLEHPEAKSVVRLTGELAASVAVRDESSRKLLEGIRGWTTPVEVVPDPVYGLELPALGAPPLERGYLAVNVRPWGARPEASRRIVRAAAAVARELRLELVGVPMQGVDGEELRTLLGEHGESITVLPHDAPFADILTTLAHARGIVSMRLHTAVLAHRLGREVAGVSYDPKVFEHFREIGREELALAIDASDGDLERAVRQVCTAPQLPAEARAKVEQLEGAAVASLDSLGARLARAPRSELARQPVRGSAWKTSGTGVIDLRSGAFHSGNEHDPGAQVEMKSATIRTRVSFFQVARAPRRGDFAGWRVPIPATAGRALEVSFNLRDGYKERPDMLGRMATSVWVDGKRLFQVDAAQSSEENKVRLVVLPKRDGVTLEVRVEALRDCEDWGWGPAVVASLSGLQVAESKERVESWSSLVPVIPSGAAT